MTPRFIYVIIPYFIPEKDGVYILPDLLQEEPVSDVTLAKHHAHRRTLLSPWSLIDPDPEDKGAQLGQGDGGNPIEDVEGGEGEEEHVPEVQDQENL